MFVVPFPKTSTIIRVLFHSMLSGLKWGSSCYHILTLKYVCVDCTVLLFYQVYIPEKETIAADTSNTTKTYLFL